MIEFEKPNISCEEIDEVNHYAKFVCEPLERGYGITLGNALRRVLLSSLPGAAITGIKIEGVDHEFQSIPNVVEDVTEIILNLKEVRFKMEEGPQKITLTQKGKGVVTAGDIKVNESVEVINKDKHLFKASTDANVKMELIVDKGRGYKSSEENRNEDLELGYLSIDSIFTPVKKVNYSIENTRVGAKVDYDKLIMEVWTDGGLTPEEAISLAAKVMHSHLELFIDMTEKAKEAEVMVEKTEDNKEERLSTSVEELGLTKRPLNCLKIQEIETLGELLEFTLDEVSKFKNLGTKSLAELVEKVKELGFEFKK